MTDATVRGRPRRGTHPLRGEEDLGGGVVTYVARRYRCKHCRRSFTKRRPCEKHIGRCFYNDDRTPMPGEVWSGADDVAAERLGRNPKWGPSDDGGPHRYIWTGRRWHVLDEEEYRVALEHGRTERLEQLDLVEETPEDEAANRMGRRG